MLSEDVYILTVPSFRFIKTNPSGAMFTGRTWHRCMAWQKTMVVVGGSTNNFPSKNPECDDSYHPIRILDASELAWKDTYDPDLAQQAYVVPGAVSQVIGGG